MRIRINQVAPFTDAFVQSVVDRLTSGDATSTRLLRLNPTLLATVQSRLRTNYARLLVYKSCDGGTTFVTSNDCRPARSVDQTRTTLGFGFQSYREIGVDPTTGRLLTNVFTDIVKPGQTYLYSFVTQTRGLADIKIVDSTANGLVASDIATALNFDTDTIASPLFRNGATR